MNVRVPLRSRYVASNFERNAVERSLLTLMVYLNDDFTGGGTRFLEFGAPAWRWCSSTRCSTRAVPSSAARSTCCARTSCIAGSQPTRSPSGYRFFGSFDGGVRAGAGRDGGGAWCAPPPVYVEPPVCVGGGA